jgi:hypothetical protein
MRAAVLAAAGMVAGAATGLVMLGGAGEKREAAKVAVATEAGPDARASAQAESPIDVCDAFCIRNRGVAALLVLGIGH